MGSASGLATRMTWSVLVWLVTLHLTRVTATVTCGSGTDLVWQYHPQSVIIGHNDRLETDVDLVTCQRMCLSFTCRHVEYTNVSRECILSQEPVDPSSGLYVKEPSSDLYNWLCKPESSWTTAIDCTQTDGLETTAAIAEQSTDGTLLQSTSEEVRRTTTIAATLPPSLRPAWVSFRISGGYESVVGGTQEEFTQYLRSQIAALSGISEGRITNITVSPGITVTFDVQLGVLNEPTICEAVRTLRYQIEGGSVNMTSPSGTRLLVDAGSFTSSSCCDTRVATRKKMLGLDPLYVVLIGLAIIAVLLILIAVVAIKVLTLRRQTKAREDKATLHPKLVTHI